MEGAPNVGLHGGTGEISTTMQTNIGFFFGLSTPLWLDISVRWNIFLNCTECPMPISTLLFPHSQ